jgi:phosphoglycerate kinase
VPFSKSGEISDDTRIRAALPTIRYLTDAGAKVVLASHLGRPRGHGIYEAKYSLEPVFRHLQTLLSPDNNSTLSSTVKFVPDCIGLPRQAALQQLQNGDSLLLENLRFYSEEENNESTFSRSLAENIDIYVNDAFGTAHRAHASTTGMTTYVPVSVSGLLVEKELASFQPFLSTEIASEFRPFAAIIGGSKISSKITVLKELLKKVDRLIIGGGMIFTFLKARGLNVGASLVEDDQLFIAKEIISAAKERQITLYFAEDVKVANEFSNNASDQQFVDVENIPNGYLGLDIGPKSIASINNLLADCRGILWNGPLGVFEFSNFADGTFSIAKTLAELSRNKGVFTVVGGGDSVAAAEQAGVSNDVSHISTGGGATLELLEGKVLPGIAALNDA